MDAGVIFGILKFLLITAGILLLLLLLLILILLFAPLRYRIKGSYLDEKADGTAKADLLFGLLSVRIKYHHGIAETGSISVIGIPIYRIEGKEDD